MSIDKPSVIVPELCHIFGYFVKDSRLKIFELEYCVGEIFLLQYFTPGLFTWKYPDVIPPSICWGIKYGHEYSHQVIMSVT